MEPMPIKNNKRCPPTHTILKSEVCFENTIVESTNVKLARTGSYSDSRVFEIQNVNGEDLVPLATEHFSTYENGSSYGRQWSIPFDEQLLQDEDNPLDYGFETTAQMDTKCLLPPIAYPGQSLHTQVINTSDRFFGLEDQWNLSDGSANDNGYRNGLSNGTEQLMSSLPTAHSRSE